jgi:peptidoglycan hydrolase CwlO-like protein|tara:strand:- start:155 stop:454 length:300 start_codon:yes stop_codon:yes gene_type:complete
MNLAELFKKNIILIPVVASILVGTFTSIRYVLNLTSTIDESKVTIIKLESELKLAQKEITDMNTRLSSAEATWQMAENLYRQLADEVREHSYDIKDLNR